MKFEELIVKYDLDSNIVNQIIILTGEQKPKEYKGVGIIWDEISEEKAFLIIESHWDEFADNHHFIFQPNFFYGLALIKTNSQFELIEKTKCWGFTTKYEIKEIVKYLKKENNKNKFRIIAVEEEHLALQFYKKFNEDQASELVNRFLEVFDFVDISKEKLVENLINNSFFAIRS